MTQRCTTTRTIHNPIPDEHRAAIIAQLAELGPGVYDGPGSMSYDVVLTCVRSEHHDRIHIDGSGFPVRQWVAA